MSVEDGARRVQAHFLIDDGSSALKDAQELVIQYPDSKLAKTTLIEALSFALMENEALDVWNLLSGKYPDLISDTKLLEELAWGVLKKGLEASQNGVRLAAMIGAYLTKDVRTVPILIKMMRDSNAVIRTVAVQMACTYRDAPLKDEIERLLQEEKIWVVRLEVIKAVGILKMSHLTPKLQAIIRSERSTYEERGLAIEALVNMYENITLQELEKISQSNRAGMRHFACIVASHFEIEGAEKIIISLISDPNPDVRIAALNAFGLSYHSKVEKAMEAISELIDDPHPAVAITAAWAAMLIDCRAGEKAFQKWLCDSLPENRRLAAAAISATGDRGANLSLKWLQESNDPYVKANLAIGLLGQRLETKQCSDCIYDFLEMEKRMWMWDTRPNPLFQILSPSQVRYVDHIPNYPEAIDQMTRLNLLSLLAIVEDPRAKDALKSFLQKSSWGITGVAAATLLQEGDDASLEIVRECLNDPDGNVRLQACLVLAMLGRDDSVLKSLAGSYAGAPHEKKLHILEALGRIGTSESHSFLIGVLKEPFPILRVAAAAALIQCINR